MSHLKQQGSSYGSVEEVTTGTVQKVCCFGFGHAFTQLAGNKNEFSKKFRQVDKRPTHLVKKSST